MRSGIRCDIENIYLSLIFKGNFQFHPIASSHSLSFSWQSIFFIIILLGEEHFHFFLSLFKSERVYEWVRERRNMCNQISHHQEGAEVSNKNMLQFLFLIEFFSCFAFFFCFWNWNLLKLRIDNDEKHHLSFSWVREKKYLPSLNNEIKTFACVYASASFYSFSFSPYSIWNFLNAKSCCLSISIILISATMKGGRLREWKFYRFLFLIPQKYG